MESPPLPLASLKTNSSRRDWKGGSFEPLPPSLLALGESASLLQQRQAKMFSSLSPSHAVEFKTESILSRTIRRLNFELRTWSWGIEIERESSAAIDRTRGYLKFNSNSHESIESRFGAIRLHPRFFKSGRGSGRSVNNYRIQKSGGKV